jgi:hypothetical protein
MLGGRKARILAAGLVCAMALAGATQAQQSDDTAVLNAEVARLY